MFFGVTRDDFNGLYLHEKTLEEPTTGLSTAALQHTSWIASRMPPKKAPRMWAMETAKKILAGVEEVCTSVHSVLRIYSYMRSLFFARSRSATAPSLPSPVSPPLCWNLTLHAYGRKRVSRTFVYYRLYRRTPFWRKKRSKKNWPSGIA
jgi:hypothetical protein